MAAVHPPIPSFEEPPVIEVVWSVQFTKLPWLTAAHTGLYWQQIKDEYPNCEEQLPIQPAEEPEDLLTPERGAGQLQMIPPLWRQWFISKSGTDLVQLQADRLCINWRKMQPGDRYPRYEYLREKFTTRWTHFCEFVIACSGEQLRVNQCELTYVNYLHQGEGWSVPAEIGNVWPTFSWAKEKAFLPPPATLGCEMTFDIKGANGRLHASCRHGRKTQQGEKGELFRFDLTARGKPENTDLSSLLDWFVSAREWIVRGFADLTHPDIQNLFWKRKQ